MEHKVTLVLFLMVIFECNGQLSILGNILSAAQDRIDGVAGAVLGGLNPFGVNRRNRPQKEPKETIIIVVEEPARDYGPFPQHPQHQRPPFNNDYPPPPPQPPHHFQNPNGNPKPGYNNQNEGPYHQNEYGNNQNSGNQKNDSNLNSNNGNLNFIVKNLFDSANNNPTTEYIKTADSTKSNHLPEENEIKKVTEKASNESPLFVPLNPDEYIYGGSKINITAPKRNTDNSNVENSDDDDIDIDVRFKN